MYVQVLFGLMGGPNVSGPLLRKILSKRLSILGSTLRTRDDDYKAGLVSAFTASAIPHIASGNAKYAAIYCCVHTQGTHALCD